MNDINNLKSIVNDHEMCSINYNKLSLKQREHLGIRSIRVLIPKRVFYLNTNIAEYKCEDSQYRQLKTDIHGFRIVCRDKRYLKYQK